MQVAPTGLKSRISEMHSLVQNTEDMRRRKISNMDRKRQKASSVKHNFLVAGSEYAYVNKKTAPLV